MIFNFREIQEGLTTSRRSSFVWSRWGLGERLDEEGDESHFMSEITGIKIVPLLRHENKGIDRFLENSFAGATKEDLAVLLSEVFNIRL